MRILVTGATGLVGTKLLYKLLKQEHDLVVLTRDPSRAERNLGIPCEFHRWNAEREVPPSEALRDLDAVIHLAGEPIAGHRWTEQTKKRIEASRIQGTRSLIDGLRRVEGKRPSVFVSASAIGYYGNRGSEVLNETSSAGHGFLARLCQDWEREASRDYSHPGQPARHVQVRIGIVLSADGGALKQLSPPFKAGVGGPIGTGSAWMSWIHLDDLISVLLHAIRDPQLSGPVNATAPAPVTNLGFTRSLAHALRRPAVTPVPPVALKLLFGEFAEEAILVSARVLPVKLQEVGFHFRFSEICQALSDLYPEWRRKACHEFVACQWVPHKVEDVFPFFSDERNLEILSPEWLQFQVVGKSTSSIQKGTCIDYRLRLHGVPITWQSRIDDWAPNEHFTDTQVKGPYSRWEHTHSFIAVKGGTLIRDRIIYGMPLGPLGRIAAGRWVARDIHRIFEFRRDRISELFSQNTGSGRAPARESIHK